MKKTIAGLLACIAVFRPGIGAAQEPVPPNAEAYYEFILGRSLELNGRWDEALDAFERALAIDPFNSAIYSEIALAFAARNDAGSAIDYAERALTMDPDNLDAHLLLARVYTTLLTSSDRGYPSELMANAIEELEQVVRLDSSERWAYLMLGQLYRIVGDPERAAEVYRDFLSIEPASEEGALSLAELQIDAGNLMEAIDILTALVAAQPDSDAGLSLLGDAYMAVGDFGNAAGVLGQATERNPDNLELRGQYAEALFLANRPDEAAEQYEMILDREPDDPVTRLRLGQIYRQQMEYEKARASLERADQIIPGSLDIRFELALLDRDEGHFDAALERFRQLLADSRPPTGRYTQAENQTRQRLMTHVAIIQTLVGQYADAVQTFEEMKSFQRDPDGTIDSYIVDTLRLDGAAERALEYLTAARQEHPEHRQLRIVEADLIAELVDIDQGETLLRMMLSGSPADLEVYSTLVGIHERIEDYDSAQDVLDEMLRVFNDNETVWFLQGALYERQRKHAEAEAAFRSALAINADNPATLNYLGYMLADSNQKLQEALGMIQTAVAADPINGAYLDSLGWVYYRLEQMDLAEQFLVRATLFSDSDPTLHEHLGDLYRSTGRIDLARDAYQRSLDRAGSDEERNRVLRKLDELPGTV